MCAQVKAATHSITYTHTQTHTQVATGNAAGQVAIYDVSMRTLMCLQRFFADHGPVTHLAARVLPHHYKGVRLLCVRH